MVLAAGVFVDPVEFVVEEAGVWLTLVEAPLFALVVVSVVFVVEVWEVGASEEPEVPPVEDESLVVVFVWIVEPDCVDALESVGVVLFVVDTCG